MKDIIKTGFDTKPFSLFDEFFDRDLDNFFNMSRGKNGTSLMNKGFVPACDMWEKEGFYLLSFDLPGMSKNDINVEVRDGQLYVSGERRTDHTEKGHIERSYGRFERVTTLPEGIKAENIEANYENGVLTLAVPKAEESKPRQITINEGRKDGLWAKLKLQDGAKDKKDEAQKVSS